MLQKLLNYGQISHVALLLTLKHVLHVGVNNSIIFSVFLFFVYISSFPSLSGRNMHRTETVKGKLDKSAYFVFNLQLLEPIYSWIWIQRLETQRLPLPVCIITSSLQNKEATELHLESSIFYVSFSITIKQWQLYVHLGIQCKEELIRDNSSSFNLNWTETNVD